VVGTLCTFILSAGLVLSRTRSAWLALGVALGVMFLLAAAFDLRLSRGRGAGRFMSLTLAVCAGIACAVLLPNRLQWKSASPYLDSIRGVVNYHEGSGLGRVTQYENTLALVRRHPFLGVGPGNWAVAYPAVAPRGDPSLALEEGVTDNPWPSSDWIAFASERGIIATACLGAALIGLIFRAAADLRRSRGGADDSRSLSALALIGTIVATLVVGAFDAVMLIAAPTMLLWTLAGALAPPVERGVSLERGVRRLAPIVIAVVGAVAIGRSAFQLAAMRVASSSTRVAAVEEAARLDPGSYRLQMRAAEEFAARRDCAKTLGFARAAHALYPAAAAPKRYLGCHT
ncbi:MAG TPA: O-antigen ligase family protein, partial [Gemmatimonadaceae bacterium]|nr:O-antigen ligase family protein [Gemmatimonadaceae bacterium]